VKMARKIWTVFSVIAAAGACGSPAAAQFEGAVRDSR